MVKSEARHSNERIAECIASGDQFDAMELAKQICEEALSPTTIAVLERAALRGRGKYNRIAAVYALGWARTTPGAIHALIRILQSKSAGIEVRGEAAEGLGTHGWGLRGSLRKGLEEAVLRGLHDPSPTIRFWCCYAAGEARLHKAAGRLREMRENDRGYCRGWRGVADEAADALRILHGNVNFENR